jgi:hypothetical protein
MNVSALNRVLGHLMETLPDSLTERKALLVAALEIMPADHPERLALGEMIHWLISHESHEHQLALAFLKSAPPFNPESNGPTGK